jgi:hypothetical protein
MLRGLRGNRILSHPYVVAELAMGSLRDRVRSLANLGRLKRTNAIDAAELRAVTDLQTLHRRGVGMVGATRLLSCTVTPRAPVDL